jgi:hypothetical protein
MDDHPYDDGSQDLLLISALPGLMRLGASAWWRATEWSLTNSIRASQRVLRAAASGESPTLLMAEAGVELREYVRRLLEIVDPPPPEPTQHTDQGAAPSKNGEASHDTVEELRERGAELLRRSAEVASDDETHPAYARILGELAPDEARILRLLVIEGPQPAVDVRSGGPIGMIKDELLAPGLNMIGMEAGVRHLERVKSHLNNLYRLGLIWFSREQLEDQSRYQVLEAQPEVSEAMDEAGRTRTIRRSINLTPFGHDFCQTCLPLDTVEIDALPRDTSSPPASS